MPDNWGYVFAAYGIAAAALLGYWRHLAPPRPARSRDARRAARRGAPMSRRAQVHRRRRSSSPRALGVPRSTPGVSQSVVYFVTPSELGAAPVAGKTYRLGGMVEPGTLEWDPKHARPHLHALRRPGHHAVRHRGTPPDLFAEGRGAVVEGTWSGDGLLQGLADHGQALRGVQGAPRSATQAGYKELMKTLRGDGAR